MYDPHNSQSCPAVTAAVTNRSAPALSSQSLPAEWQFTPIRKGAKAPLGKDWQKTPYPWQTVAHVLQTQQFASKPAGAVGVLCGPISGGLLMFDHDGHSCDALIETLSGLPLAEALPHTVKVTSGREGRYQLAYQVPEKYWSAIRNRDYQTGTKDDNNKPEQIEFRWQGRQSVTLGEHPMTEGYRWVHSPADTPVAEAPLWMIERMLSPEFTPVNTPPKNHRWSDREWALSYLEAINPDYLDWYTWRNVLLGAHAAGLSEAEVSQWSQRSAKHTDRGFSDVWRHIKGKADGIGLGTLGYLAKKDGWVSPFGQVGDGGELRSQPNSSQMTASPKPCSPSFEEVKAELRKYLELESPSEQWRVMQELSRASGYQVKALKELAVTLDAEVSGEDWVLSAGQFAQLDTGCNEFLIEEFLPANVAILFGSQGGLGKTLLLNDLVYALATGTEWGGYQIPKRRNILFIQTDESESNTQERWELRGLSELDNVWIIRTFVPAQMNRLKRTIEELNIDVVVLDSLTSVQMNSGISYKDPEYGRLIYEFKKLASELRVTPIIIVHTNKSERADDLEKIAGSYAIGAAASEVFILSRPKEGNADLRVLSRVKSRKFPLEFNLLLLHPDDLSFENQGACDKDGNLLSDSPNTPAIEGSARERVKAFLIQNPGVRFHSLEVANHLGIAPPTARKLLSEMHRHHIIKRSKLQGGEYAGKPGYYLPLPAVETEDLEQGEIIRLLNLSAENLEEFEQQQSRLTPTQRESLYARAPHIEKGRHDSD
ncbi:bifunctional DNA primase/polymerase [Leptothoe sp. ISB3NOV94-8A]